MIFLFNFQYFLFYIFSNNTTQHQLTELFFWRVLFLKPYLLRAMLRALRSKSVKKNVHLTNNTIHYWKNLMYRFLKCQFSYICKKQQISENIEKMMNISPVVNSVKLYIFCMFCTFLTRFRGQHCVRSPYQLKSNNNI